MTEFIILPIVVIISYGSKRGVVVVTMVEVEVVVVVVVVVGVPHNKRKKLSGTSRSDKRSDRNRGRQGG